MPPSSPFLLSTIIAASATATTLYFIYDSHRILLHKKKLAKLRERRLKLKPKRNTCGKILFVSRIGTSKAFAKRLCEFLASEEHLRHCVYLELVDARNYDPEELPKENIVLLVASNSEHWKRPPECFLSRKRYLTFEAENFGSWLQHNAENFGSGVFVVKACSFSVFGVGSSVSEGGKNLMAKAANRIRDLGSQATKFDAGFDFDNWWQGVVAVLKGAVLGDTVADAKCQQSEPEDDAGCCDPKRIYILVENRYHGFRSTTYSRRMLTISDVNFTKNGTVDLEDGGPVTVKWPLPHGGTSDSSLPLSKEFCCSIGLSLFFLRDLIEDIGRELDFDDGENMWCLKYDGHTWIWSLCRTIIFPIQLRPIIIPYDGKLCFIGDNLWVDIYNLKSEFWEKREVPASVRLNPHSYFLWETLIVLYSLDDDNNQWLMSYDLNANIWSPIECNFPPFCDYKAGRKLVRLGCSDFLLIIDFVNVWYIYDLSKKKFMAIVHVNELDEIGLVSNVFCCHHTSKESLIYVFINLDEMYPEEESFTDHHINIVPYARVKLQTDGNFSAKVESKGNLKVGPYRKYYMFAGVDQDIKKEIPL
ncbi:hypothetical protein HN51_042479 [Arachis hypogaea]|nr:S-adenosyl-L-methionine-dependent tRNA 4-demethylwyosine synthase [Arachis hypogaea]